MNIDHISWPASIFKPFRDYLLAKMDVNLPQQSLTRIDELVRHTRWDNHDLPRPRFKRRRVNCKSSSAFLDDNAVKSWSN